MDNRSFINKGAAIFFLGGRLAVSCMKFEINGMTGFLSKKNNAV